MPMETVKLLGKNISVEVWRPTGALPRSGVVVAYGTEGMLSPFDTTIRDFCAGLAAKGWLVARPDFFTATATSPGVGSVSMALYLHGGSWVSCLSECLVWTRTQVNGGKVALAGFSLGGNLVLNAALAGGAAAVVDYFGPVEKFGVEPLPTATRLTAARCAKMPQALIHHGKIDKVVPLSESDRLASWLVANQVPHKFWKDYNCGHPGEQKGKSWPLPAEQLALTRTIQFLGTHL